MIPTQPLVIQMAALLGADTTTLAEATPFVEVILLKAAFTPGPALVIGDLTPADFDGYAAKSAGSAATQVFSDPATGDRMIQVVEPLGGWHWETTGVTNLPQTIHGFALVDSGSTTLWGAELLDDLIVLTAADQAVDLDQVNFRLLASPMS